MGNKYLIDPDELAKRLGSDDLKVIDCRFSLADTEWGRNEYEQSHIPGAVYAHMNEDLSGIIRPGITGRHPLPEPDDFIKKLSSWGIRNNDWVVIYDQSHGGLAARLWWMLRWMGHDNICVLNGGWSEWSAMHLPVTADISEIDVSSFRGKANPEMVIDMEKMSEWTNDVSRKIVDARANLRYTGEHEPIDPVAGHIPGAISMPFLDNIDHNGRWKSSAELKSRFADIMAGRAEDTVVYCGSGVTACHNILALEIAGFHGVHLYPGSWSEWITRGV